MKKMLKYIVVMIFFLGAMPVSAMESSNDTTGADSTNTASLKIEKSIDINNSDKTNIENNIDLDLNTGGNSASKNTGNGSVSTGDIAANIDTENTVTGSKVGIDNSVENVSTLISENRNTGANSENNAKATSTDRIKIVNNNNNKISNDLSLDLSTGNNSADKNTGNGEINTGNIDVGINIINKVLGSEIVPGGGQGGGPGTVEPRGQGGAPEVIAALVSGLGGPIAQAVAAVGGMGGGPTELPVAGGASQFVSILAALFGTMFVETLRRKKELAL